MTLIVILIRIIFRAGVAQLVEYKLPKLGVAGSIPVARSNECICSVVPGFSGFAPPDSKQPECVIAHQAWLVD